MVDKTPLRLACERYAECVGSCPYDMHDLYEPWEESCYEMCSASIDYAECWERYFTQQAEKVVQRQREQIVRCKDCKHFDDHYGKCHRPVLVLNSIDSSVYWTDEIDDGNTYATHAEPDGFCAWGDRKFVSCRATARTAAQRWWTND